MEFIINYWVEVSFCLLITFVMFLFKRINKYYQMMIATRNGVQTLLKTKIIEAYNSNKEGKNISLYEIEIINNLYREYRSLGGNGLIENIVDNLEEKSISKSSLGGD